MKNIDLVIFDLAGTTIEDKGQVVNAFLSTLAAYDLAIGEEELRDLRGKSKREAIRQIVEGQNKEHAPALSEEIYAAFRKELSGHYEKEKATLMPGFSKTIEWLRSKKIKCAFTTGFDRTITRLILASIGWKPEVPTAVICGDDVTAGRPAPFLIFHAMEAAGVHSVSCVANVGDTINDLYSGWNAGTGWNIGVCSGAHSRQQLQTAPHTHLIPHVGLLPSIWE